MIKSFFKEIKRVAVFGLFCFIRLIVRLNTGEPWSDYEKAYQMVEASVMAGNP